MTEQGDHPPMLLSEIFLQQSVRENPPPVELLNLPREVLRRLVTDEQLPGLPESIDVDRLEEARRTYQERPARPVLEALGQTTQAVVLGDPGAGKSTLARFVMVALAGAELQQVGPGDLAAELPAEWVGRLPLLVELRMYADPDWRGKTFLDLIDKMHTSHHLGLPKNRLERYLRDGGRALVLFDGLDEIFDPQVRADVTGQIEGFVARYPNVRTIVTSRVYGYDRSTLDAAGFTTFMLQDLDTPQIKAFVTNWFHRSYPDDSATAARMCHLLLETIRTAPAAGEIAGNPMLLTILAIIARRRELPRERRAVYQHAVTVLIEHWDVRKHLRAHHADLPQLEADDKLRMLHHIARRMQDAPDGLAGNHLPAQDLIEAFETYLTEEMGLPKDRAIHTARAMRDQFQKRNFILSSFGAGLYGFIHRAFLEYLAADDISQRVANRELEDEKLFEIYDAHATDSAWREVLLLLTGMIPEALAAQAISRLAGTRSHGRPDKEIPAPRLLAISAIGEIRRRQILKSLASAITDLLVKLIRTAAREEQQYDRALAEAVSKALPPFNHETAWLDHSQRDRLRLATGSLHADLRSIRHTAARLRLALEAQTLDTLKAHATTSVETAIRLAGVEIIAEGWPTHPETLAWLNERATVDVNGDVRSAAVQAIARGWPGRPETLAWLRNYATQDEHWRVRDAAVRAIAEGWPGHPDTFTWLRECATADSDEEVRRTAMEAIARGWFAHSETFTWLHERATADSAEDVRSTAVQAIARGWPERPETLAWLRNYATQDEHWRVRDAAVRAIAEGWPGRPDTFTWLCERATVDSDEDVRSAASKAIARGWPGRPDTFTWLCERATADIYESFRSAAIEAIAQSWPDHPKTLTWLRERTTTDAHEDVRRAAVQAIAQGWPDHPETFAWLRERATADTHQNVRRVAIEAVAQGWPDHPETFAWLRERATADTHQNVRRVAI
ncbi:HEAT repeat domain-containing protein, partial [Nonomuraea rubra]|uniref:HEAT repeat domain-containing protein n=1 Tax=Nonomuraea rubra TaxID=46180 RepID=UPI0033CB77E4